MSRDTAEVTLHKEAKGHAPDFQHQIKDVLENGATREDKENWESLSKDKVHQSFRVKEAITRLSKWNDNPDEEDNLLAKVAWFCISSMEIERREKEELEKEQKEKLADHQKQLKSENSEERKNEAGKRASV